GDLKSEAGAAAPSIEIDHLFQAFESAIVHVGSGEGDVPKSGNFKGAVVTRTTGDFGSSSISLLTVNVGDGNYFGIRIVEYVRAVTFEASSLAGTEQIESAALLGRQCIGISSNESIKRRVIRS